MNERKNWSQVRTGAIGPCRSTVRVCACVSCVCSSTQKVSECERRADRARCSAITKPLCKNSEGPAERLGHAAESGADLQLTGRPVFFQSCRQDIMVSTCEGGRSNNDNSWEARCFITIPFPHAATAAGLPAHLIQDSAKKGRESTCDYGCGMWQKRNQGLNISS